MDTNTQKSLIGSRIMQRRKLKGLKQKELAEQVGLSDNQISNIENGVSFPRMGNFLRICDVLDTAPDYFLAGTIHHDAPSNVMDMIAVCSPQEQKTISILLDAYVHRDGHTC